jgi:hypothetical protein
MTTDTQYIGRKTAHVKMYITSPESRLSKFKVGEDDIDMVQGGMVLTPANNISKV